MSYFYSRSTRGFYRKDIHGDRMPADVVPVTEEQHAALMRGQEQGIGEIGPDELGRPTLRPFAE